MIPIPFNEQSRLAVLDHFDVIDSQPEERLDRITRLASRCFDVPIAVISLVTSARQWFMSSTGLEATETPREVSFCAHAIMNTEVFVILDAKKDPRFTNNPLVTNDPKIRFYAGAPLITARGFRLGTLCLIDRKPRAAFGEQDKAALSDFAELVVEEMYSRWTQTADDGPAGEERPSPRNDLRALEQDQARRAQLLFIASLSHELRTPLNAILGFSEVLHSELFGPIENEKYLEYARHINASGTHLAKFVDSILDYVKAEKGEISNHDEWVDLAAVILNCQSMFTEQMRHAELKFCWRDPEDLPPLKSDRQLIMQMLINLIGNSIKFTPAGGKVDVAVGLVPDGGMVLSVTDTGIGIAPGDLQTVLVPFGQAENAITGQQDGIGLGLSLTRQFVELHDGELSIESEPQAGTTVRLHFPAYRVG